MPLQIRTVIEICKFYNVVQKYI